MCNTNPEVPNAQLQMLVASAKNSKQTKHNKLIEACAKTQGAIGVPMALDLLVLELLGPVDWLSKKNVLFLLCLSPLRLQIKTFIWFVELRS